MQNLFTVIQSVAIMVASIVAIIGINTWRNEFLFKKKVEVAEETLFLFYQCSDHIRMIRNPFYAVGEGASRIKSEAETKRQTEVYNQAYVVRERYGRVSEPFQKLNVIKYRFMVYFGEDKAYLFEDFNDIIKKLFHASSALGRHYWLNVDSCDQNMQVRLNKERDKYESIIWPTDVNDEINNKIDKLISEMGEICKEYFK
jgi:hypothetical protein